MAGNGIGTMNENGELFADFCGLNNMIIWETILAHRDIYTNTHRYIQTEN